jgi:putative endonuclease
MPWSAYIVRCRDGSLYSGVSTDVGRRVAQHNAGTGAKYTRARRPVELVWRRDRLAKPAAHRLEARLKRLSRPAKLAVIAGKRPPPLS